MKLVSYNPANGEKVGEVEIAKFYDVQRAVKRARETFLKWRNLPIEKRASFVEKFQKEFLSRKNKLAKLETLEMGKPLTQSRDGIIGNQKYLKYYASQGPKILAEEIIEKKKGILRKVIYEPIGVVAVITPWNYPFGMSIWGIMPNLVAGNTVVFKPSEYTPLCGEEVVKILKDIGLPEGVVNITHGDGKVGKILVDSKVDFVWFTGSSQVGQEIYQKCGKKFIQCLLELGGSGPAIVFPDVEIDKVVKELYMARFSNCGQVCSAVKRLFVHQKIYRKIVDALVKKVQKTKVGNPFDKVDFGPLVSKKQLTVLIEQVKDAIKKGARVEVGGGKPKDKNLQKGNYYLPTILTNVNFAMRVLTEEVFGPVLPIIPFEKTEEVIEMANRTEYGLTAEIYSKDRKMAEEVAGKLEAGLVSLNSNSYFSPKCPFGGWKKSGMGREGGRYGFYELTQMKYLCIR